MNCFSKNLKYLRNLKGLSQVQLGKQLDLGDTAISSWERKGSQPGIEDIEAICKIFAVTADALLFSDIQNVHLPEKSAEAQNVHQYVHPNVHLPEGDGTDPAILKEVKKWTEAYGNYMVSIQDTNKTLSIAIKGLEAANSVLIRENEELKEENMTLKKGSQSLGEGTDNPKARRAG